MQHHRRSQDALFFKTHFVLVLLDGSCGEQKAQEEEMDRAAGNVQAKVQPWAGWGKVAGGGSRTLGTASGGPGVRSPSSWNPFSSGREMNSASHWAQIHCRVTGSERPGWAFHSDVCAPPKHSDLRQVAEDLVGKASLYFSDCPA